MKHCNFIGVNLGFGPLLCIRTETLFSQSLVKLCYEVAIAILHPINTHPSPATFMVFPNIY